MSNFLKALKDLARIATMERSDENRYERQRANANAKQEAFICSDHQFCSGFRVHESHSLLFNPFFANLGLSTLLNPISILTAESAAAFYYVCHVTRRL